MAEAARRTISRPDLGRLATPYIFAFWLANLSFYATLARQGYDVRLALVVSATGGLACLMLRFRLMAATAPAPQSHGLRVVPRPPTWPGERELLLDVERRMHEARRTGRPVGVMVLSTFLVRADDPLADEDIVAATEWAGGALGESAGSAVYRLDKTMLAVVDSSAGIVANLEQAALSLQKAFRARAVTRGRVESVRLTIGLSADEAGECSPAELLMKARVSVKLAEALRRDIFYSSVR